MRATDLSEELVRLVNLYGVDYEVVVRDARNYEVELKGAEVSVGVIDLCAKDFESSTSLRETELEEEIGVLERKVQGLEGENYDLENTIKELRKEVEQLSLACQQLQE